MKVWATTTVSKLKSAIVQRIKSKNAKSTMTESNFKLSCNQARMPNEQTMADFSDDKSGVKDSMVVTRSLRIRGGGVRKPYLKDNLVAKSVSLIEKKIGPPLELQGDASGELLGIIAPMQSFIKTLEGKIVDGIASMKTLLEKVEDGKLQQVKEIFKPSVKTPTEQTIIEAVSLINPMLARFTPQLSYLKSQMIRVLVGLYGKQYGVLKSRQYVYGNESFLSNINEIQAFRKGMRSITSGEEPPAQVDAQTCVVM